MSLQRIATWASTNRTTLATVIALELATLGAIWTIPLGHR
jgi:hypothetical protein